MPKWFSIPEKPGPGGKKYPFEKMSVGDWILAESPGEAARACTAANKYACKPHTQGFKCSQKKHGPGYWRVTRIA